MWYAIRVNRKAQAQNASRVPPRRRWLAASPYWVFLKYPDETACPVTKLKTVSPAPRYESAMERIDDSGIWVVSGLQRKS